MTFTHNGIDYDEVILAGQAERPQDYDPIRRQVWNKVVAEQEAAGNPLHRYADSVLHPCQWCGIDTRIGPRQQGVLTLAPNAFIVCMVDAPLAVAALNAQDPDPEFDMLDTDSYTVDLGNTKYEENP